jgi:hypothetical protein
MTRRGGFYSTRLSGRDVGSLSTHETQPRHAGVDLQLSREKSVKWSCTCTARLEIVLAPRGARGYESTTARLRTDRTDRGTDSRLSCDVFVVASLSVLIRRHLSTSLRAI